MYSREPVDVEEAEPADLLERPRRRDGQCYEGREHPDCCDRTLALLHSEDKEPGLAREGEGIGHDAFTKQAITDST